MDLKTGKKKIQIEYCYNVGHLEWNQKEPWFEFKSVELHWLESGASKEVIQMILDFVNKKEEEFLEDI